MDRYLAIFLPVIWVLVSAGISLLLYKTSESLYEVTSRTKGSVKRIRLVGSIVLAALVFWGLAQYTPKPIVEDMATGTVRVPSEELQSSARAIAALNGAAEELFACVHVTVPQECTNKVDLLRARLSDVDAAHKRLQQGKH